MGAASSHGDVPVAVPVSTWSCADWPGASVVVVVGAGAAGFVAAGALVLAELEHPVNTSATTARPATAVPA